MDQVRHRVVEQASPSLQSMAEEALGLPTGIGVEPLLRVRCALQDSRYWQDFGQWPSDPSAWQVRPQQFDRQTA